MRTKCSTCGAKLPKGGSFCPQCGAKSSYFPHVPEAPQTGQTAVNVQTQKSAGMRPDAVRAPYYFWTMFLYNLPLVGFILTIVEAACYDANTDWNKKKFAQARMIWWIIGIAAGIILAASGIVTVSCIAKLFGSS